MKRMKKIFRRPSSSSKHGGSKDKSGEAAEDSSNTRGLDVSDLLLEEEAVTPSSFLASKTESAKKDKHHKQESSPSKSVDRNGIGNHHSNSSDDTNLTRFAAIEKHNNNRFTESNGKDSVDSNTRLNGYPIDLQKSSDRDLILSDSKRSFDQSNIDKSESSTSTSSSLQSKTTITSLPPSDLSALSTVLVTQSPLPKTLKSSQLNTTTVQETEQRVVLTNLVSASPHLPESSESAAEVPSLLTITPSVSQNTELANLISGISQSRSTAVTASISVAPKLTTSTTPLVATNFPTVEQLTNSTTSNSPTAELITATTSAVTPVAVSMEATSRSSTTTSTTTTCAVSQVTEAITSVVAATPSESSSATTPITTSISQLGTLLTSVSATASQLSAPTTLVSSYLPVPTTPTTSQLSIPTTPTASQLPNPTSPTSLLPVPTTPIASQFPVPSTPEFSASSASVNLESKSHCQHSNVNSDNSNNAVDNFSPIGEFSSTKSAVISPQLKSAENVNCKPILQSPVSGIPRLASTIPTLQQRTTSASSTPSASRLPSAINTLSRSKMPSTFSHPHVEESSSNASSDVSQIDNTRNNNMQDSPTEQVSSPISERSLNATKNKSELNNGTSDSSEKQSSPRTCVEIKSKIGSLNNASYKPRGGNVKIFNENVKFQAEAKCRSKENIKHKPGGGNVRIIDEKLKIEAQPKVASFEKVSHKPGGGDVKILSEKLSWEVKPKVNSLENSKHKAGGGDVKIEIVKLDFKERAQPKVGSLDNKEYTPRGGTVKIFSEIPAWIKAGGRPNLPSEDREQQYRYIKKSGGCHSVTSTNSGEEDCCNRDGSLALLS